MSHVGLSARDLSVSFGDIPVLDGANVEIAAGRRLALLGANGSGKTTLLRCLAGSLRPDTGEVLVDGSPVEYRRSGLKRHRELVQLVLQDPDDQLFSADVRRDVSFGPMNLGLPEPEVRERVDEALHLLGIADLADRPVHRLSYGQRKRAAIAGAVAMRPCVLLLDEPTSGLDPVGVDEMVGALTRLEREHTTVALATHNVNFAIEWADSVAIVVGGQVVQGDPAELLGDVELLASAHLRLPMVLDLWSRVSGARRDNSAPGAIPTTEDPAPTAHANPRDPSTRRDSSLARGATLPRDVAQLAALILGDR